MLVFFPPIESKMTTTEGHSFITVTYAKIIFQFLFFSKTTEPYETKHSWNIPWMGLYKTCILCVYHKFKMATITAIFLTLVYLEK
jgi:hypothetical protein